MGIRQGALAKGAACVPNPNDVRIMSSDSQVYNKLRAMVEGMLRRDRDVTERGIGGEKPLRSAAAGGGTGVLGILR